MLNRAASDWPLRFRSAGGTLQIWIKIQRGIPPLTHTPPWHLTFAILTLHLRIARSTIPEVLSSGWQRAFTWPQWKGSLFLSLKLCWVSFKRAAAFILGNILASSCCILDLEQNLSHGRIFPRENFVLPACWWIASRSSDPRRPTFVHITKVINISCLPQKKNYLLRNADFSEISTKNIPCQNSCILYHLLWGKQIPVIRNI